MWSFAGIALFEKTLEPEILMPAKVIVSCHIIRDVAKLDGNKYSDKIVIVANVCLVYLMNAVNIHEFHKTYASCLCFKTTFLFPILISGTYMQVLFSSIENGRSSFVRQLEPDWHIDTNSEIITQLAVCYFISRHHSASQIHTLI